MQSAAPVRLLPIVIAVIVLVVGFRLSGHMLDTEPAVSPISPAQAQDATDAAADAGATEESAPQMDEAAGEPAEELDPEAASDIPATDAEGGDAPPPAPITAAEQEVLESLQQRRMALDQREEDLLLRERLLQAAETRLEQRIAELREIEGRIDATIGKHEEQQREQLESLVGMYENMKPKDAARIFDRLNLNVLVEVVEQMATRRMAPILAKMDPAVAERLTVELAARAAMRASDEGGAPEGELQDP